MWWILGIAIVGYIIYLVSKDYKEEVKINVSNQGGMQSKYNLLIEYFTAHPSSSITKITRDNITISSPTMTVYIDYVGGNVEIDLKAMLPVMGKVSKKWKYPSVYPQEKMIQEIENYLDWEISKFKDIAGNNFGQYIQ